MIITYDFLCCLMKFLEYKILRVKNKGIIKDIAI